tara:strand:+ start:187 stop:504 length:318 start_codon:yes stop_codon:yes gene_type:complete
MKFKNKLTLLLITIFFLNSCGTGLKDALEGKRRSKSGDEFLIQKKNPLTLPPKFGELPVPSEQENVAQDSSDINLKNIFNTNETTSEAEEMSEIESFILKEINKN